MKKSKYTKIARIIVLILTATALAYQMYAFTTPTKADDKNAEKALQTLRLLDKLVDGAGAPLEGGDSSE
jgi:flagellar basal body-associated protein FliL